MVLLNNKEQRLISFLSYLNIHKKITLKEVSTYLNCSKSTVINDIHYFSKNWSHLVSITLNKDHVITFQSTSNGNTNKIIRDISINSLEILFMKELFLQPNQNIYYYADKIFTSPATLYRVIKKLNTNLKNTNISIHANQKKYHFVSPSKIHLYFFIVKNTENLYGLEIPTFSNQERFRLFNSLFPGSLDEEQYFLFLIWELSEKSIHTTQALNFKTLFTIYQSIPITKHLDTILNQFLTDVSTYLVIDQEDLSTIRHIFLFTIKRDILLSSFETHFPNRYHLFIDAYAKQNTCLFSNLEPILKAVIKQLGISIEFSFDYLLFLLIKNFSTAERKIFLKNIFLYSDLGQQHAQFLAQLIKSKFSHTINQIHIVAFDFFDTYQLKKNDVIISTSYLETELPIIFVDDMLSDEQLLELKAKLNN